MTGTGNGKHKLCLIMAPLVWSIGYVAQSIGGGEIDPFSFIGTGFLLGAGVLFVPVAAGRLRRAAKDGSPVRASDRSTLTGGLLCGLSLAGAQLLQQIGLSHVAVGKAGFLTSLSVILVPVLTFLLGKKTTARTWASAAIALTGLYIMFMEPGSGVDIGIWEWCLIGGAFLFAVQSILLGHFSPGADSFELSFVQFLTAGVIGTVVSLVKGSLSFAGVSREALLSLLFFGIISCAGGFTLQVAGQKAVDPCTSALLVSLEAPFSVITGFLLLGQVLSGSELAGCAVMMAAILFAQLPERESPESTHGEKTGTDRTCTRRL